MVVKAKTKVTATNPVIEDCAAGYINIGISGSHGPSTNTKKGIHGVRLAFCSLCSIAPTITELAT